MHNEWILHYQGSCTINSPFNFQALDTMPIMTFQLMKLLVQELTPSFFVWTKNRLHLDFKAAQIFAY